MSGSIRTPHDLSYSQLTDMTGKFLLSAIGFGYWERRSHRNHRCFRPPACVEMLSSFLEAPPPGMSSRAALEQYPA
ncbi:MAG TPA: hypothetical protein V6C65_08000 [Allocoleopsis sp.]